MSEERDIRKVPEMLNFMFKKVSIPTYYLAEWFKVPEFTEVMLEKVSNSQTIDNAVVLDEMQKIYTCLSSESNLDDVNPYNLRRGINMLIRVLYPDEYEQRKVVKRRGE